MNRIMMKRVLISLMLSIFTLSVANAASDITDVIKTLRKGKVESALKTRSKIKITSSPDQFLYQLSECLAYNSKKNPQYNPLKAYDFYKRISYSDYVTNQRVMNCMREAEFDLETVRMEVEANLLDYARSKGTVDAYDKIINTCESCSYLEEAKKGKEDIIFKKTLKGATLRDVEKFILDYPNSPNRDKAINMRDSIAFVKLPKSADAYASYMEKYPNSKYASEIQSGLLQMSYDEAKANDNINSYAKFIGLYPNEEKKVKEFEGKIEELQKYLTWKVEPKYKNIRLAEDSIAKKNYYLVNDFGKWGIMDFTGKELVAPSFDDFSDIADGKLIAKKGGKWGVINPANGSTILDFVATSASDIDIISKNFIAFKQGNLWGLSYKGEKTAIQPFVSGSLTQFKFKVLRNGGVAMTDAGKLVIVDPEGNTKVDEKFDQVQWRNADDIDSKYIKVRQGKKYGIYNPDGDLIGSINHDMMPYYDQNGIAIIKTSPSTEGWMDTTGAFLYCAALSEYKDCGGEDKMIAYKVGSNWGFLDKTPARANIKPQYEELGECFADGIAKVKKAGKWIYINKAGEEIVSVPESQNNKVTRAGGIIYYSNGSSYDMYDKTGKIGTISGFSSIDKEVSNGMLIVNKGGQACALQGGKECVTPTYDDMTKYCNGYSVVTSGDKKGLLYYGQVVLEAKYEKILDPNHAIDGDCDELLSGKVSDVILLNVFENGVSTRVIVKAGKIVTTTKDEVRLKKFANKFTAFETAEMGIFNAAKTGLINPDGKIVVEPYYRQITELSNDYFVCKDANGKCGVLDKAGSEVVVPFAQSITSFDGKVVEAELNGDKMCFSKSGVPFLPKNSELYENGVFKNKKNNKFGLVDKNGYIKLYTNYGKITGVKDKSAVVLKNDKYGVVKY